MKRFLKVFSLGLFSLLFTACGINNIPSYDEDCKAKWSQVENQYKRRLDLLPNLVSTVKGIKDHEKETLTAVIKARQVASKISLDGKALEDERAVKSFQRAQEALSGALSRLMVVVEKYPDLKANQNFLALQSQLEGTENRISIARRDYIEAVRVYNTELRTFPGKLWKSFLYSDAKVKANFTQPEEVQNAPKVEF